MLNGFSSFQDQVFVKYHLFVSHNKYIKTERDTSGKDETFSKYYIIRSEKTYK